MQVGEVDGYGHFGVLDEDAEGVLCHECGGRFTHLGLHAYKAHAMSADEYRRGHGLGRRGLVVAATREIIVSNARERLADKPKFTSSRDPARATEVRLKAGITPSPAGLEAMRQARVDSNRARRLGTVVTCARCSAQFCPLTGAKRRKFCSRSCASRYNWARSCT